MLYLLGSIGIGSGYDRMGVGKTEGARHWDSCKEFSVCYYMWWEISSVRYGYSGEMRYGLFLWPLRFGWLGGWVVGERGSV